MVRPAMIAAVLAAVAVAGAGLPGRAHQDAQDGARTVRAGVQARVNRTRDDALARARAEAGRAVARARHAGDSPEARSLESAARARLRELRGRVGDVLGGP